jgi:cell division control protein 6
MLEFEPYTAEQLQKILEDTAEQAFKPGAVDNEVIEAIADEIADSTGDCRQAFKRLLQAGRQAMQHGAREVTQRDLAKVDG